jgi:hypothetical protein
MGLFGNVFRAVARNVKGIKVNPMALIKGIKRSGGNLAKGIKSGAQNVRNRVSQLLFKPKVMKEKIIQKGTAAVKKVAKEVKPVMKPIQEVAKKPFVRQVMKKADRLKAAKKVLRNM